MRKTFGRNLFLKQHIDGVHHKLKEFICEKCMKQFSQKSNLRHHIAITHSLEKKRFKCEICEKCYTTFEMFKQHNSIAHGVAKFKSEFCFKTFSTKNVLNNHIQGVHERKKTVSSVKFVTNVLVQSNP